MFQVSASKDFINLFINVMNYSNLWKIDEDEDEEGRARDSQTRTGLEDALICITCSLENNAFFVMHHVINVALHYYMLHRFEIFSAPGTIAHGSIRLLVGSYVNTDLRHQYGISVDEALTSLLRNVLAARSEERRLYSMLERFQFVLFCMKVWRVIPGYHLNVYLTN